MKETQFNLYNALRLFYANGGGVCIITSVGDYGNGVKVKDLREGLEALIPEQEASMVVVPDATLLDKKNCYDLYKDILKHCGKDTKDRFAILDIHGGDQERTYDTKDVIGDFREGVGNNFLGYGAAYYPWLNTTVVSASEVSFKNISNHSDLVKILTNEARDR